MILETVLPWAIGAFALALALNAWRLLRGPGLPDRILALDTLSVNAAALLVLLGLRWRTALFVEMALVIGLLGFVATVMLARQLEQRAAARVSDV